MKLRTIGCVNCCIGMGMQTADEMVKAANVELVMARTTCPGRYLIVVTGDTGAAQALCRQACIWQVRWWWIRSLFPTCTSIPAMNGTAIHDRINALGVIETYTAASCVLAADAAAKAGEVSLLDLRLSAGLGGKAFAVMTGEVSAVQSS